MAHVRAIVTYRLTGDLETAKDVMRRVAAYTREHFADRLTFDPYVNEESGRVIWVNAAVDEDSLVDWEADMGDKTGFRVECMSLLEPVSMDLLDPVVDPRLERLREASTMMTSMLV